MRLLLTSDLHRDGKKLLWLLDEAPEHDALLVAGDLLDIFSNTGFVDQTSGALRWKDTFLKSGKSFAWCSGNHDFFNGDHTPMFGASPLWMQESARTDCFVSDGESRLLKAGDEHLIVTTIPWPATGAPLIEDSRTNYLDYITALLQRGRKAHEKESAPWIVLNHEPPEESPLCPAYSSLEAVVAKKVIGEAQPDFSLHGHVHEGPTTKGGLWIWRYGKTICFNAGQSEPGEPLHYISLTWNGPGNWSAVWNGAGRILQAESRLLT